MTKEKLRQSLPTSIHFVLGKHGQANFGGRKRKKARFLEREKRPWRNREKINNNNNNNENNNTNTAILGKQTMR